MSKSTMKKALVCLAAFLGFLLIMLAAFSSTAAVFFHQLLNGENVLYLTALTALVVGILPTYLLSRFCCRYFKKIGLC
jgi:hypothetical protein